MTVDSTDLRRLAQAATPGPWEMVRGAGAWLVNGYEFAAGREVRGATWGSVGGQRLYQGDKEADAAFIAAANPSTVLALLDDNDALRDEVDRLHAALSLREYPTCPHIVTADEGTSHCSLSVSELWTTFDEEGQRWRVEPVRCNSCGATPCDGFDGWPTDPSPRPLYRLVPIDPQETHE